MKLIFAYVFIKKDNNTLRSEPILQKIVANFYRLIFVS